MTWLYSIGAAILLIIGAAFGVSNHQATSTTPTNISATTTISTESSSAIKAGTSSYPVQSSPKPKNVKPTIPYSKPPEQTNTAPVTPNPIPVPATPNSENSTSPSTPVSPPTPAPVSIVSSQDLENAKTYLMQARDKMYVDINSQSHTGTFELAACSPVPGTVFSVQSVINNISLAASGTGDSWCAASAASFVVEVPLKGGGYFCMDGKGGFKQMQTKVTSSDTCI